MFVHAEGQNDDLNFGDLSCFITSTDFSSNFYEYEIPLKPTPHFSSSPIEIWPIENNIDIDFEIFQLVKQERNFYSNDVNTPYETNMSGGKVTSCKPNLSQIKTIMIGVRNPNLLKA